MTTTDLVSRESVKDLLYKHFGAEKYHDAIVPLRCQIDALPNLATPADRPAEGLPECPWFHNRSVEKIGDGDDTVVCMTEGCYYGCSPKFVTLADHLKTAKGEKPDACKHEWQNIARSIVRQTRCLHCDAEKPVEPPPVAVGLTINERALIQGIRSARDIGNVQRFEVGGGVMGHDLCHENEAPFPLGLPAFFVRSFCPPGGIVCDPFSGSGTTCHAAIEHGRRFIGCDIRESQVKLGKRRMSSVTLPLPVTP